MYTIQHFLLYNGGGDVRRTDGKKERKKNTKKRSQKLKRTERQKQKDENTERQ